MIQFLVFPKLALNLLSSSVRILDPPPPPPKCWNYKHESPSLAGGDFIQSVQQKHCALECHLREDIMDKARILWTVFSSGSGLFPAHSRSSVVLLLGG